MCHAWRLITGEEQGIEDLEQRGNASHPFFCLCGKPKQATEVATVYEAAATAAAAAVAIAIAAATTTAGAAAAAAATATTGGAAATPAATSASAACH